MSTVISAFALTGGAPSPQRLNLRFPKVVSGLFHFRLRLIVVQVLVENHVALSDG